MITLNNDLATLPLTPFGLRNTIVDSMFYDIHALTADERLRLGVQKPREGSIIVVSPKKDNQEIRHYKSALRFFTSEGDNVKAIVVAGVGSSVLGTAAFARNIADAGNFDVAGVISGYGLTDVATEILNGFLYGKIDKIQSTIERKLESWTDTVSETPARLHLEKSEGQKTSGVLDAMVPANSDCGTLLDVLIARPPKLKFLIGHSKGNLVIDFVLEILAKMLGEDNGPGDYYKNLTVVTIGAVVAIPDKFKHYQFLGSRDWLGRMNSNLDLPHEAIPGASHHTNPDIPHHLSVADVLKEAKIIP